MPTLPDIELPDIVPEPTYRPTRTVPIYTEPATKRNKGQ